MIIAPEHTDVRGYALAIHQLGYNVLPMKSDSKAPDIARWKKYQQRPQTKQDILSFNWTQNIAIVNGYANLRTADLDQCTDAELVFYFLDLLGLTPDYRWIIHTPGKGGGFHIHFHCVDPLTLTTNAVLVGDPRTEGAFKQLELRWSNCYTMFPPSIHPEAQKQYDWAFGTPEEAPATLPLETVEKAFLAIAKPQKETAPRELVGQPRKFDSWAQKALTQEGEAVRNAQDGGRNKQLNRSSFNLGQIVGAELLDREEAEGELTRAALFVGLKETEIIPTIKSGIEAGMQKPRMPKQVYKASEPPPRLKPTGSTEDEKMASFSVDHQGHAEAVYHLYGHYLAYNDSHGWLIWNGTHFTSSVQRVNTLIVEVIRRRQRAAATLGRKDLATISICNAGVVNAVRELLENLAFVPIDDFDTEADLFNTHNGIVDMRTKKLLPHDPTYKFTWCSPVAYNPDANNDLWIDFTDETFASDDIVQYIQQALGYSLTGHTGEESLYYAFGPPRAGKGTMTQTIRAIVPYPICTEVDFNTFTAERPNDTQNFDMAPLKPARIVFASESNKYQSLNPAKIKRLIGGDGITCAFKYGQHFKYTPQYTIWLSSNHACNGDPEDDALWGRVKVIDFPYSKLGKEDKSLKDRMLSPESLEGILAWLIEGAYQWYQRGPRGLRTPQSVLLLTRKQREKQDSIGLWINSCCERGPEYWTENSQARTSYENWCEANGYEPKKARSFGDSLTAHGLPPEEKKVTLENGKRKSIYGHSGFSII